MLFYFVVIKLCITFASALRTRNHQWSVRMELTEILIFLESCETPIDWKSINTFYLI